MQYYLRVALAALFCCALPGWLPSAFAQSCATIEHVATQVRSEAPGIEIRVIFGPRAARLRTGISTLIGQQVPDGDSYLIARLPGAPTSYVVRFADGCATHHGRFPDELLRAWIDGVAA